MMATLISAHSCGCIILFPTSLTLVNSWSDVDGRYLQCEFSFCTVFDRSLDPSGSDPFYSSHESSSALLNLFYACCVIDIWRYLNPSTLGFTWTRWNVLTFPVFRMYGCLLSHPVILSRVLFLTIVP